MTSPFEKYLGTELAPELIAIIPPDAKLSAGSTVDPKNRGKVPGTYNFETGTWSGRPKWVEGFATHDLIKGWSRYPDPNIGIRAKYFPGIDFDVDLDWLVQDLLPLVELYLGPSPVRGRDGSPRVMLMYRLADGVEPIGTFPLKFTLPQTGSTQHAIEILGNRRSFVLEGRHAKGGQYQWKNGIGPTDYGAERLSPITAEKLRAFVAAVKDRLTAIGATILSANSGTVGSSLGGGQRREIGDPALMAINLDTLKKALELIPCEEIHDRGEWVTLVVAAKAGCGGKEIFYENVLLPWCLRYEKNTKDYIRRTWDSIKQAELGADYIYGVARRYTPEFCDDVLEIFHAFENASADQQEASSSASDRSLLSERRCGLVPKLMPPDFSVNRIPPRSFVLGNRFMAGTVTLGVAPPGTGKSNFSILTALSIATGRSLTGEPVHSIGPVWIHNNEDSLDELYRRIGGVLRYHQIEFEAVRKNIFVTSGLDQRLVVAIKANDIVVRSAAVADVINEIKENGIVHLVIDPFVSTHRGVSENSNEEIEQVIDAVRHIAHQTGCSVDLIHHSLKTHSHNTEVRAGDMNAARGAGALIANVRIIYTLAAMTAQTARVMGIPAQQAARLVRLDQGKGNYSPRDPSIRWFELETVQLGNGPVVGEFIIAGDTVAVPVRWNPPAVNGQTAQVDPIKNDTKEVERQRVRDFLAKIMPADRCKLSSLIGDLAREFGVEKTTARNRVMKALSAGSGSLAQADGTSFVLTIESNEPSPPNPVFVVRKVINSDASNDDGSAVSSVISDPAAFKLDICKAARSDLDAENVDALAELVPA